MHGILWSFRFNSEFFVAHKKNHQHANERSNVVARNDYYHFLVNFQPRTLKTLQFARLPKNKCIRCTMVPRRCVGRDKVNTTDHPTSNRNGKFTVMKGPSIASRWKNRYPKRYRYRTRTPCAAGGWRKRDDSTRGYPLRKGRLLSARGTLQLTPRIFLSCRLPRLRDRRLSRVKMGVYNAHTARVPFLYHANCFARRSSLDIFKNYHLWSPIINSASLRSSPLRRSPVARSRLVRFHLLVIYETRGPWKNSVALREIDSMFFWDAKRIHSEIYKTIGNRTVRHRRIYCFFIERLAIYSDNCAPCKTILKG